MRGLACALLARPKNLFANPKKKIAPTRRERTVQRDPGSSLHVTRDEALVVRPPASPTPSPIAPPSAPTTRPPEGPATVRGRFFFVGDQKLYLRGVTYGTFRPRADGSEVDRKSV